MALFKKKTSAEDGESASEKPAFSPEPEKARKWFDHARAAAMSSSYGYALELYANGIKLDPGAMTAHESMLEAAIGYRNNGEKPATGKEIRKINDGTPIGKFAAAEFEWMKDLQNHKAALKLLETAVKAEQLEIGNWVAPRVFTLVRKQKKLTKSSLLQAMDLFRQVGAWDESMEMGEMARTIDPADSDLDSQLKNLSAQRAMDQGGYSEAVGEEGGFRKFIKDADRQQELLEEETLSASASIEERNLHRAKQAYEETPKLPEAINRYAQQLKKQGEPEAEQKAIDVYEKGFAETGEYRFKMASMDIRIEQMERQLREIDEKLESQPGDETLATQRIEVSKQLLETKRTEYTERVAKYPTDRVRKFELGEVQLALGLHDDAMAQFQAAKDEPKLRVRASHRLGRCFLAEEWHTEAISEFEEALEAIDSTERDFELPIRYDLMLALLASASHEQSIDLARQAMTICSEIARKDITYRDIRVKRKEVDRVIKELGAGGA